MDMIGTRESYMQLSLTMGHFCCWVLHEPHQDQVHLLQGEEPCITTVQEQLLLWTAACDQMIRNL